MHITSLKKVQIAGAVKCYLCMLSGSHKPLLLNQGFHLFTCTQETREHMVIREYAYIALKYTSYCQSVDTCYLQVKCSPMWFHYIN